MPESFEYSFPIPHELAQQEDRWRPVWEDKAGYRGFTPVDAPRIEYVEGAGWIARGLVRPL